MQEQSRQTLLPGLKLFYEHLPFPRCFFANRGINTGNPQVYKGKKILYNDQKTTEIIEMTDNRLEKTPVRKIAVILYTIGLTEPFWFAFLILFGVPDSAYVRDVFQVPIMLVMTILVTILWMNRPGDSGSIPAALWVLGAAFLWTVLRFVLDKELFLAYDPQYVWFRAYTAWFLFFPWAMLLTGDELRRSLCLTAGVWAGCMSVVAALAIICVATNSLYYTAIGTVIGIQEYDGAYRLWITNFPTISAENLLTAAAFAVPAIFAAKRKWLKICFGLMLAVLYVAIGLTDGRAAMIAFGILIAVAVMIFVLRLLRNKGKARFAAGLGAAAITVVLVYGISGFVSGLFPVDWNSVPHKQIRVTESPVQLLEYAAPEEAVKLTALVSPEEPDRPRLSLLAVEPEPVWETPEEQKITIHREIDSTLSGRTWLWSCTLKALKDNNGNMLLLGRTPYDYLDILWSYGFPDFQTHVHSIYLQVLVEWGLPGLMLMLAFLILFAVSALRLIFNDRLPFWQRFAPAPAIALLAVELVDCFMRLNDEYVALQAGFLFMGLTIGLDFKNRRHNRFLAEPASPMHPHQKDR